MDTKKDNEIKVEIDTFEHIYFDGTQSTIKIVVSATAPVDFNPTLLYRAICEASHTEMTP